MVLTCSMSLLPSACRFADALERHVSQLGADADALRAAHARKDDELGRLVDGVTSQLAAAREGMRAKQDLISSSEAQLQRLHSEASAPPFHQEHAGACMQAGGPVQACVEHWLWRRFPSGHAATHADAGRGAGASPGACPETGDLKCRRVLLVADGRVQCEPRNAG